MPNSTGTAATNNTYIPQSHVAFHEDDYTHPCHPLYVHPSDVVGNSLVSVPFDGTCYGSWKRNILVALSIGNKLDLIDANSQSPHEDSPLIRQWKRCNDLAVLWLTNSMTKEIARKWYGQADAARIFELKKELAHISQGSLDVAFYFNKIKQLWDEIASLSSSKTYSYTCEAKSKYAKDEDV
ncbi:uncharacterized protein LOC132637899 [Lycium barbarum]|uniref:uncharacterized protein LOC132637899 n=1 Tax=Lycium barbarum TaxID=112863 RepID=UPI00293E164C|nr:uncharacterized protein LOC132637899 [Lycium barbarum]